MAKVRAAQEYIKAGDVIQVVPSQRSRSRRTPTRSRSTARCAS
jgi:anthranilate/para-aminobenzoate synthase component I